MLGGGLKRRGGERQVRVCFAPISSRDSGRFAGSWGFGRCKALNFLQ